MDYYGFMSRPLRQLFALALLALGAAHSTFAASPTANEPNNSGLDRDLFYELLVGELSAQAGDNSAAYALLLDAARKSNAPRLYQRAVELALGARSGESALDAARAWNNAFPASPEANRYLLQILIGMNRIADIQEPLKRHLSHLSAPERTMVINLLPRYFARATDKNLVATVVEQALANELKDHTTGAAAWSTVGLLRLQAGDSGGAMEASRRAAALNTKAEEPAYLALGLMGPKNPAAETLVLKYLAGRASPELRMTYVRNLLDLQRNGDAYAQAQIVTRDWPDFAEGWLVQGSLELQNQKLAQSETSLKTYLARASTTDTAAPGVEMGRGIVQAYFLLAQIAEQTQRLEQAQTYLQRIDSPKDALRVASRQAAILARQGKLDQARAVIRKVPELQVEDERAKISAEVQLLRENRQYLPAYQLLVDALARYPQDSELLYDQAMLAEKVGNSAEMERLLRQLIEIKPDFHHAYNALGFSLAERNIRLGEARTLIAKALELAPNDPFIVDSMAWVEFRSGNATEALKLLQGAFESRPDAEIAAHMGEVLWTTGQREQALAIWKKGAELNPDNETLLETTERLQSKK